MCKICKMINSTIKNNKNMENPFIIQFRFVFDLIKVVKRRFNIYRGLNGLNRNHMPLSALFYNTIENARKIIGGTISCLVKEALSAVSKQM